MTLTESPRAGTHATGATLATGSHDADPAPGLRVLYVVKRYPRLSETFIVRELLGLEVAGVHVGIDALLEPEDGPRHADVDAVRAQVRHLPRKPRWTAPVVGAHARVALRHPARWARRAWMARRGRQWRRFLQAGLVADRARREGFHHIHAHFATAAADVARDAAALAGIGYSVTAHAKDIFHAENVDHLPARLRGAATVVTVSHYNVRHLRAELPGARVRYVPNGLPMPEAVPVQSGGPVLCVARLVPKKGIDLLIRAMAVSAHARPLEIVGDGTCRAELEALAVELGIESRVHFRGALTAAQVDMAYRRCSMLALPCRIDADGDRDGMPTVLIEAMARSIPVVSTAVIGLDELVTDGVNGRLVAPEDPAALAAAIDHLLDDPDTAALLGERGRERVVAEFAPEHATAALLDVFDEAAGR